jgi:hypothetical protein
MNMLPIVGEGGIADLQRAMRARRNSCPPLLLSPCLGCWSIRDGQQDGYPSGVDFQEDMRRRHAAIRGPVVYEDEERTFWSPLSSAAMARQIQSQSSAALLSAA